MDAFHMDEKFLYRLLRIKCDRETVDYVLQEMEAMLGECQPDAEQVRAYLQAPDEPTTLNIPQQIVAMDKLLECAEIDFRTTCDLFRYQQMKKAGVVDTVDEFLQLVHPDVPDVSEEE